ncbi:MAG: hypothetical protein A2V66_16960 [Ignavibacteria bacterium RBG_13_36_8]|nr:MAG: hypothetical protein A2V66_16960 [Ignavibacteria bacterium RBG_13_36_8]
MINKLLLLILLGISLLAQSNVEKLRDTISEINVGFLNSQLPGENKLELIEKSIDLIETKGKNELNLSEIKTELSNFRELLNSEQNVDSLKKAFRSVNNKFNSVTGNYFYDKIINSPHQKIIVFSTSMSCECTLEMCYKQEAEIQKLQKEKPDLFDYAVVDCFTNFDLQSKYGVEFIPTVVIFDPKNMEVKRFVRDENLYNKIKIALGAH